MTAFHKVVVLGLDGVPFSLLEHLFQMGVMPILAEMAKSGAFLQMETTLPAVSSVAWTSFMTGRNPGEHGIFGFTDVKRDEISLHLPSFDDIRCPTIWQRIQGKRSLIVNLPFTYPARPVTGTLIAGFVAPIFERSVYPQSLIPWLKSRNYRTDVDAAKGRHDRHFLIRDLFETLNLREEVMLTLMDTEQWDLFIGVLTGTDRLHHFFFDAYDNSEHPFHHDFMEYYRRIDSFFGRLLDRLRGSARLIILSDHGFTRLDTQIYVNHMLKTMGYLSVTRPDPRSLDDIDPSSPAFAMDPSRIYLNSRERFKGGRLTPREAEEVRMKLKVQLGSMRLMDVGITERNGVDVSEEPVFADIRLRDDIYTGQCVELAPDLVIVPRRGYDLKAALDTPGPTMTDIFSGMHTHDDAFLIADDCSVLDRLPEPRITDVAGLILESFV